MADLIKEKQQRSTEMNKNPKPTQRTQDPINSTVQWEGDVFILTVMQKITLENLSGRYCIEGNPSKIIYILRAKRDTSIK